MLHEVEGIVLVVVAVLIIIDDGDNECDLSCEFVIETEIAFNTAFVIIFILS